jgi:hypothetical protein
MDKNIKKVLMRVHNNAPEQVSTVIELMTLSYRDALLKAALDIACEEDDLDRELAGINDLYPDELEDIMTDVEKYYNELTGMIVHGNNRVLFSILEMEAEFPGLFSG